MTRDLQNERASVIGLSLFVLAWALLLLALHLAYGQQFPVPWNDEVHFLIPSANLALTNELNAPQMLNGNGIFWMPSVMYLVDATVFKLTASTSLATGRWIAWGEVFAAAICLQFAVRRLLGTSRMAQRAAWIIAAFWSLAVPVQMASNLARPDGLSMLLAIASLAALLNGRYLMVLGLAGIDLTTHPLRAAPSLVLAALACLRWRGYRPTVWDGVIALAGLGAVGFELRQFVLHHETYVLHLAMQVERKGARGMNLQIVVAMVALLASGAACLLTCWRARFAAAADRRIDAMACIAFGCAYLFVYTYGREMAYTYALYSGGFAVLLGLWRSAAGERRQPLAAPLFLAVAFLLFIPASWGKVMAGKGWSFMDPTPSGIRRVAAEQQWLHDNGRLMAAAHQAGSVVDPFLYPLLIPDFGPSKPLTYSPLSPPPDGLKIERILTARVLYPMGNEERPMPEALLRGYACTSVESLVSPGKLYVIDIRSLQRIDRSSPFRDCPSEIRSQ